MSDEIEALRNEVKSLAIRVLALESRATDTDDVFEKNRKKKGDCRGIARDLQSIFT